MNWINEQYEPTDSNVYSAECSNCHFISIAYGEVTLNYQFCPNCSERAENYLHQIKPVKNSEELLKEAINDINQIINDNGVCHIIKPCAECPFYNAGKDNCKWKYVKEV